MSAWRPEACIRAKVIGLAWRGDQFLAAEIIDDAGRLKGMRPLGGSIEFGEPREAALTREFQEELGAPVVIVSGWTALENIFQHEGATGHEIVFVAEIVLGDAELYRREEIAFHEDDGTLCKARWVSARELEIAGVALYPNGLDALVARADSRRLAAR
jgi:8-oxo-dGTP pyrophosphatase MutT (NUDIX family)